MTDQNPPVASWSEISLAKSFLGEYEEPPVLPAQVIVRQLLSKISYLENQAIRDNRLLSLLERENERLSFEAYDHDRPKDD